MYNHFKNEEIEKETCFRSVHSKQFQQIRGFVVVVNDILTNFTFIDEQSDDINSQTMYKVGYYFAVIFALTAVNAVRDQCEFTI